VEMAAKPYPTDLTDAEWDWIKALIPPPKPGGGPVSSITELGGERGYDSGKAAHTYTRMR